jgi:hypothetical protein
MTPLLALVAVLAGASPAGKVTSTQPAKTPAELERGEVEFVLKSGTLPKPEEMEPVIGAELGSSPLDGCEAERLENGWRYGCGPDLNVIQRDYQGAKDDPAALALGGAQDAAAKFGGAVQKPERLKIGADDVALVRLEQEGGKSHTYIAAVARPNGVRGVVCITERAPNTCVRVLEALVPQPWPQPAAGGPVRGARVKEPPVLTLGERRVNIPPGCSGERKTESGAWGGDIRCAHGQVLWRSQASQVAARETLDRLVRQGGGQGKATTAEFPCRIVGAKATCRRTRVEAKEGATTILTGVTSDGTTVFSVLCWVEGTNPSAPPCGAVFELR